MKTKCEECEDCHGKGGRWDEESQDQWYWCDHCDAADRHDAELAQRRQLHAMKNKPQGIEAKVCDDITERQALGIAKYKKTVADNPLSLREWLQHAYEECLDQSIYLRRAIAELDRKAPATADKASTEESC